MSFVRIRPDDLEQIGTLTNLYRAARAVDDPDALPVIEAEEAYDVAYGHDLEPSEKYLYVAPGCRTPVGVLELDMPVRDNRHLTWAALTVHPEHRRQGHGSAMMTETLQRTRDAGRTTVWAGIAEEDTGAAAFLQRFGFCYASHDARRRQRLADVDRVTVQRLHGQAEQAARDYRIERLRPPLDDDVLADLVEVTNAINDAPMGELTHEEEVFDVARLRNSQVATELRGGSIYRIIARHRDSGAVAAHTVVHLTPRRPDVAFQGDTAVSRDHRGHRLGMLLKTEMMCWLGEVAPQLEVVETWNNADNRFMIDINEALGYRLSRVFATYQLVV